MPKVRQPTQLSELLSEAGLTYQDYLKAALIAGNRGGDLSKENTCFAVGTPEGLINLTEALKLDTVAEGCSSLMVCGVVTAGWVCGTESGGSAKEGSRGSFERGGRRKPALFLGNRRCRAFFWRASLPDVILS
jgi:hypothetical protein